MKKIMFMAVLAVMCLCANAQVKKDSTGVYTSVSKVKAPAQATGEFYRDSKGIKYPIYKTATGHFYIVRVSKNTGKEYKAYIKLTDVQWN